MADAVLSAARHYHELENPRWFAHILLLMPDHLHAIMSFPPEAKMKATLKAWKGFLKRNHGVVWQGDFFDHRLRDEDSFHEKFQYIRMNPVRKGLCHEPGEWPHVVAYDRFTGEELGFGRG
ncbi:MAG: hypothetical protein H7A52_14680 [Akkermansiaceae bacterium]|nr:hypothetical protein [Akkermansiaceae bacterium]